MKEKCTSLLKKRNPDKRKWRRSERLNKKESKKKKNWLSKKPSNLKFKKSKKEELKLRRKSPNKNNSTYISSHKILSTEKTLKKFRPKFPFMLKWKKSSKSLLSYHNLNKKNLSINSWDNSSKDTASII